MTYPWQIKLVTQLGGKYSLQTFEFKTKKETLKALPSKYSGIQRHGRSYYVMVNPGK